MKTTECPPPVVPPIDEPASNISHGNIENVQSSPSSAAQPTNAHSQQGNQSSGSDGSNSPPTGSEGSGNSKFLMIGGALLAIGAGYVSHENISMKTLILT